MEKTSTYALADVDMKDGMPAVNVKVYNLYPLVELTMKEFGCDEDTAQKAVGFALESAQEAFWAYWLACDPLKQEPVYFPGETVTVQQEGRSGGWLAVAGLPAVHGSWTGEEDWDDAMIARWQKFEADVLEDVRYRTSWEAFCEDIRSNDWAREGAQMYNHVDTPAGVRTLADLNTALAETSRRFYAGEDYQAWGLL